MGKPEKGQSIERIDNDLGYYKENCKWASHSEQVRNRGNHRMITYAGRTQCCADWADEIGMIPDTFTGRLDDGWTVEEAITTPVMRKKW